MINTLTIFMGSPIINSTLTITKYTLAIIECTFIIKYKAYKLTIIPHHIPAPVTPPNDGMAMSPPFTALARIPQTIWMTPNILDFFP